MLIAYVQEELILVAEFSLEERNSFIERNKKLYEKRHPETKGRKAGKYSRAKWYRKVLGKDSTARTAEAGGTDSNDGDVHLYQQEPGDDNR